MSHRRQHVTGRGKGGHENKAIRQQRRTAGQPSEVTDAGGWLLMWLLFLLFAAALAALLTR